jgi:pyridinium-3,5-biscarboxylic acid mononucleotide sulfurtransferase
MIMANAERKLEQLKENLIRLESVAVAFSGGVDSTFLLKVARDVLGEKVVAVTAQSSTYPDRELREAVSFAEAIGVKHVVIESEELDIDGFAANPVNRCYLCKKELFSKMIAVAREHGLRHVVEGSNADDLNDYRPGLMAIRELGILSPLKEASLGKDEVRMFSRELSLPTWDKPAYACLSSRIPYGQEITKKKLRAVEEGEQFLLDLGFRQVRVRHHGDIARIEVAASERVRFADADLMDKIDAAFKAWGFAYVALDLKGYRTGSMNEVIDTGMKLK